MIVVRRLPSDDGQIRLRFLVVGQCDWKLAMQMIFEILDAVKLPLQTLNTGHVPWSVGHWIPPFVRPILAHQKTIDQLDGIAIVQDALFDHLVILIDRKRSQAWGLAQYDLIENAHCPAPIFEAVSTPAISLDSFDPSSKQRCAI